MLGSSEAKIHNVPVDEIHFHEVGAIDAIVDIVAASAGIHHLNVGAWYCSPINVGGGTVVCAHGTFPVPAPATADLLRGLPTYSAHILNSMKLTAEDTPVGNSGSNVAGRIVSSVPEDIAGEINAALRNWRDALVSNDPARLSDCYAGTVDRYFLQTNVTHDYVKQYIVNMHDRGDSVTDEGISQINLQRISASTVEARFIETFDSLAVGQDKKGTVRTILHFTKEVGAWKISYERQLNIPPEGGTQESSAPPTSLSAATSRVAPVSSANEFAIVFDPPSNVRVAPSAASGTLCSVTTKTSIRILGSEGSWYKTDICNGNVGYIHRSQVKF